MKDVRRLISEAASKKSKRLSLRGCELDRLPEEVLALQQLESLTLSENRLRDLPQGLADLGTLTELLLDENEFKWIGDVCTISSLKILSAGANRVEQIPPEIAKLKRLEELDLPGNRIERIPIELASLPALRRLDLSDNRLRVLPPGIVNLRELTELFLVDNDNGVINDLLWQIPNLKVLYVDHSQFTLIPKEVLKAGRLKIQVV